MPKISVVVPIYNAEQYLEQCVDSIIHQSLKDIEIILVNDGSTDGSRLICEHYLLKDNRVRLIEQNNQGQSNARNQGIKYASGEWFIGVDADDWCDFDYLETLLRAAESEVDIDVVVANCKRITNNSNNIENIEYRTAFDKEILSSKKEDIIKMQANTLAARVNACALPVNFKALRSIATPWDKIYRMDIIKKNNLKYQTGLGSREDIIFALNFFHFVKKIKYIHNYGYNYRVVPDSASHGFRHDILQGDQNALKEMHKYIDRIPLEETKWKNTICQGVFVATIRFLIDELGRWYFNNQNSLPYKERLKELSRALCDDYNLCAFENVISSDLSKTECELLQQFRNRNIEEIWKKWEELNVI